MVGICVQEKEMEKQKLLYQQARLHDRGAAEMVLQTISASKGEPQYVGFPCLHPTPRVIPSDSFCLGPEFLFHTLYQMIIHKH